MDNDSSSQSIAVTVEAEAWTTAVTDPESLSRHVVQHVLDAEGVRGEVSVLLADDDRLRTLNRDWRGKDRATNVLSFPADRPLGDMAPPAGCLPLLGDIAVACETVRAEAEAEGKRIEDHLSHLLVHGTLHLLGYDHEGEAEAQLMEGRETRLLAALGIADPYRQEAFAP